MRALKTTLKIVLFAGFFVISVALGTLAAVWARPEWLLNEANTKRALASFAPKLAARWSGFQWSFDATSVLEKKMLLEISGLCVSKSRDPELNACFSKLKIDLSFALGFSPRITEIRTLLAEADHFRMVSEKSAPGEPSHLLPDLRIPSYRSIIPASQSAPELANFELGVKELSIGTREEAPMQGSLRLSKLPESGEEISLRLNANVKKANELDIKAELSLLARAQQADIRGKVSGLAAGWRGEVPIEGTWSESVRAALRPVIRKGRKRHNATIELNANPRELILSLSPYPLPGSFWPGRQVKADSCRLVSHLHKDYGYPAVNDLRCALSATATSPRALLKTVTAELHAKAALKLAAQNIQANIELDGLSRSNLFLADIKRQRATRIFRELAVPQCERARLPRGNPRAELRAVSYHPRRQQV